MNSKTLKINQQDIEKIVKQLKCKDYQTIQVYLRYDKPITSKIKYTSFKLENKIIIISDLIIPKELDHFLEGDILKLHKPKDIQSLKSKSGKDLKKLISKRIILIDPINLTKLGFILSKYKKKPVYLAKDITKQVSELLYQKPLNIVKSTANFKVCKANTKDLYKTIIEKIQIINSEILENQSELKISSLGIRSTMSKIYETSQI
jgi:hypothetical protein